MGFESQSVSLKIQFSTQSTHVSRVCEETRTHALISGTRSYSKLEQGPLVLSPENLLTSHCPRVKLGPSHFAINNDEMSLDGGNAKANLS